MQKTIAALLGLGLFVSTIAPSFASAETIQDSLKKIQDLSAQIKALQSQILGLQQQQQSLQVSSNQAVVEILASLKEGSEGDQVTLLQTLLALDASIYPEGKVTGFFGGLTRKALQRFQQRNGLEGVGFVGPRTRAALNKMLKEHFKEVRELEDEVDDDLADDIEDAIASISLPSLPNDPCGIPSIPSGGPIRIKEGKIKLIQTGNVFIYQDGKHKIIITPNTYHEKNGKKQLLITPGMRIEKDGKSRIMVPCNGNGTTTPPTGGDTSAPVISDIASNPSQNKVTITWKTNEDASGKVFYGTSSPLNLGNASSVTENSWWWFANLGRNHSVTINGLTATTTYYFVIESKDKKGNTATSSQQSFKTTGATEDTTAPTISVVNASAASTTATVAWTTNEAATSKVYFGTTTPLVLGSAGTVSDSNLVTSHSVLLPSLTASTTYYMVVESKDAANNGATSSETSFVTTN